MYSFAVIPAILFVMCKDLRDTCKMRNFSCLFKESVLQSCYMFTTKSNIWVNIVPKTQIKKYLNTILVYSPISHACI